MASKKNLKKDVKFVTWELISECLVFQVLHPEVSDDVILDTLQKIADKHNAILDMVNANRGKQEKTAVKKTYTDVVVGLNEMAELVKNLYAK